MKHISTVLAFLTLLGLTAMPGPAAEMKDLPDIIKTPPTKTDAGKPAAVQTHKGQGTVNNVDAKAGKVNLTHGAIATLKWPGMTMDFQVKDQAVLKGVTPGQNVEFDIVQAGQSQFVITRIAPATKKK